MSITTAPKWTQVDTSENEAIRTLIGANQDVTNAINAFASNGVNYATTLLNRYDDIHNKNTKENTLQYQNTVNQLSSQDQFNQFKNTNLNNINSIANLYGGDINLSDAAKTLAKLP